MTRTPPRSFSTAGTLSRRALVVVGSLLALSAVTAVVAARANTNQDQEVALGAAREILMAAKASHGASTASGCPTISTLADEGRLTESARTDDAWGNRFRIVCIGSAVRVESAGPDQRSGTSDDLRIEDATL
ncbi:MAG TPA: hypothetical protein VH142_23630 [Polyangiaceae bacterium]|jgi:hypothetical protein|nr:hypothetical protein [Polyangiaceae bacterium]